MGGFGSGNYLRWQRRKRTVEESFVLTASDFRGRIYPCAEGNLPWTCVRSSISAIDYFINWENGPSITLHYRWRDSEEVIMYVGLQSTPTKFGQDRWWFVCPVCNRRVGNLYLPPGAHDFECRTCHGLTYRSCQEAHKEERLWASLERIGHWADSVERRQRAK
jgi:hypothetical protein